MFDVPCDIRVASLCCCNIHDYTCYDHTIHDHICHDQLASINGKQKLCLFQQCVYLWRGGGGGGGSSCRIGLVDPYLEEGSCRSRRS